MNNEFYRAKFAYRPLSDREVEHARRFTSPRPGDTLLPCRWALAEATGRESEIPRVTIADFDPPNRRVWLPAGGKGVARWGHLTPSGLEAVKRRIDHLGDVDPSAVLSYEGSRASASQESAVSYSMRRVLDRAGLSSDPAVRPASVRAWAGLRVFRATHDIVEVAVRLGTRSADDAFRIIALADPERDAPPPHRAADT